MPQRVRANVFSDASEASILSDHPLDASRTQAAIVSRSVELPGIFAIADEKGGERILANRKIVLHALGSTLRDEYWSVFLALTAHHELSPPKVDVVAIEVD